MRSSKTTLILLGWIFVLAVSLMATETGEIRGKVVDETGEILPGVGITAKSASLQGVRSVLTSKNGEYHLPLLPIGRYTLTFSLEAFSSVVQENVIIRLGRVTILNTIMKLSEIKEEIIVTASSPLIDKTSIDT
ncbi:MAG: carboxypeptidase regulatory-like domain-containing protein, partial [Proteobacteria bacterium]|nr:carboxypeptidase regulatory-like domain-containing protein [Pseudomonadota bacterium]